MNVYFVIGINKKNYKKKKNSYSCKKKKRRKDSSGCIKMCKTAVGDIHYYIFAHVMINDGLRHQSSRVQS